MQKKFVENIQKHCEKVEIIHFDGLEIASLPKRRSATVT